MFWPWKKKPRKKEILFEEDRRKEPRLEDLNDVTIEPRGDQKIGLKMKPCFARTKDASASGLRVECEVPFPVDALLNIKLVSPKTRKIIQATGIVKWVTPLPGRERYDLGVEFVETPVRTIMSLLEHIYKA
jgi:PilZ domain